MDSYLGRLFTYLGPFLEMRLVKSQNLYSKSYFIVSVMMPFSMIKFPQMITMLLIANANNVGCDSHYLNQKEVVFMRNVDNNNCWSWWLFVNMESLALFKEQLYYLQYNTWICDCHNHHRNKWQAWELFQECKYMIRMFLGYSEEEYMCLHIETEIKWSPLCKRDFELNVLERKVL